MIQSQSRLSNICIGSLKQRQQQWQQVGKMAATQATLRGEASRLLNEHKLAVDTASKIKPLRHLKEILVYREPSLLQDFIPHIVELQSERSSPVRKYLAEMIEEISSKHFEYLHDLVPVLIAFLHDDTPAVARQAVNSGINLLRITLERVVLQGIHSGQVDSSLKDAWSCITKLKEAVYMIAFQPGFDGVRLLAVKFVETAILLFTPDPSSNQQAPLELNSEDKSRGFNIKWIVGGHPTLNIELLGQEASKNLSLLLDLLRIPAVKSLSTSLVIVLVNSLASIAKRRPSLYGKVMPVLIGLATNFDTINGHQNKLLENALKNAFVSFLKCSHHGVYPWREHLVNALQSITSGDGVEHAVNEADKIVKHTDTLSNELSSGKSQTEDDVNTKGEVGKKRSQGDETKCPSDIDDRPGKRLQSHYVGSLEPFQLQTTDSVDHSCSNGSLTGGQGMDSQMSPVQQLVAMFGAIVAQGDKAQQSIEILLSQISTDLLAEVVMANMPNLPAACPASDDEEEELQTCSTGESNQARTSMAILSQLISMTTSEQPSLLSPKSERHVDDSEAIPAAVCSSVTSTGLEKMVPVQNIIPGATTSFSDDTKLGSPEQTLDSPKQGLQHQLMCCSDSNAKEASPSTSATEKVESPAKGGFKAEYIRPSSASSSVMPSSQSSLPAQKIVVLEMEQQAMLSRLALQRVVESHKQVSVFGGSELRLSLLSKLLDQGESDSDIQGLLETHILADYDNFNGQELTLNILYQRYKDMVSDQKMGSSIDASALYENILLNVAQHLHHSYPSSSKLLDRLLAEAPVVPDSVLNILRDMCITSTMDTDVKGNQMSDKVTQGLTIIWNLILYRPPMRAPCLQIALETAVDQFDAARSKAIRLVANRLYPLSYVANSIETFATKMMLSVVDKKRLEKAVDADVIEANELDSVQPNILKGEHDVSTTEAERCMSLYFALCIKKHSLLQQIFFVYEGAPEPVKQVIQRHLRKLVITIKNSPELLNVIADPPKGSENLVMQALHDLTEVSSPSRVVIDAVKRLFEKKSKDAGVLIPILSSLSKEDVQSFFPHIVNLPADKFQEALARILHGSKHSRPPLTPTEVLITLNGIDPKREGLPIKKVTNACCACLEQKDVFTQQVLASAINIMIEKTPLPLLFMRTVIEACAQFPSLVGFIKEILVRLVVSKQIWKYPNLWNGFLMCARQTLPHSLSALIQLPAEQLEKALNRDPALRKPLTDYANQPDIKYTASRPILIILGIIQENQQPSHGSQNVESADAGSSGRTINEAQASESAVGS